MKMFYALLWAVWMLTIVFMIEDKNTMVILIAVVGFGTMILNNQCDIENKLNK